jgi:hypothetical protein
LIAHSKRRVGSSERFVFRTATAVAARVVSGAHVQVMCSLAQVLWLPVTAPAAVTRSPGTTCGDPPHLAQLS